LSSETVPRLKSNQYKQTFTDTVTAAMIQYSAGDSTIDASSSPLTVETKPRQFSVNF